MITPKVKKALSALLVISSTVAPAFAQSAGSFTAAPFVVGSPGVFAASILDMNLQSFFGGARNYIFGKSAQSGSVSFTNTATNTNSEFNSDGSGTVITSSRSFVTAPYVTGTGFATAQTAFKNAFGANVGTQGPTLVLTALEDSSNPRLGSSGVLFQGISNVPVTQVAFQYSPISTTNGFTNGDLSVAPYLAVDDSSGQTKYFSIASALVASNYQLNLLSGNFNSSSGSSNSSALDNAFISVVFNTAQLGIQGNVQRIGLVQFKRGIVFVNNITVNGVQSTGTLTQNSNTFPF